MVRVAVLGSTGMLGSTLTRVLTDEIGGVIEFNRSGKSLILSNDVVRIDVKENINFEKVFQNVKVDYIFNAIGLIKQLIDEKNPEDLKNAITINSDFAVSLNNFSLRAGIKVIQIGTDCVFSGNSGSYSESSKFSPTDVYGKSKNAGELGSTDSMILRSSIIGIEQTRSASLLSWVLSQPRGATINGFTNHLWNGLTTLHFSRIVSGIIKSDSFSPGIIHVVPRDVVSKFELLRIIAKSFNRNDLIINEFCTDISIDRSLITMDNTRNTKLWNSAGSPEAPSISEMVSSYAKWLSENKLLTQV